MMNHRKSSEMVQSDDGTDKKQQALVVQRTEVPHEEPHEKQLKLRASDNGTKEENDRITIACPFKTNQHGHGSPVDGLKSIQCEQTAKHIALFMMDHMKAAEMVCIIVAMIMTQAMHKSNNRITFIHTFKTKSMYQGSPVHHTR
jgi:hypothetical protein